MFGKCAVQCLEGRCLLKGLCLYLWPILQKIKLSMLPPARARARAHNFCGLLPGNWTPWLLLQAQGGRVLFGKCAVQCLEGRCLLKGLCVYLWPILQRTKLSMLPRARARAHNFCDLLSGNWTPWLLLHAQGGSVLFGKCAVQCLEGRRLLEGLCVYLAG